MSDTVKLSELLEARAASLSIAAEESVTNDMVQQFMGEAKALHAIAPALVEIAKKAKKPNELHGSVEDTHIPEHCPACRLVLALAKAGVTCE